MEGLPRLTFNDLTVHHLTPPVSLDSVFYMTNDFTSRVTLQQPDSKGWRQSSLTVFSGETRYTSGLSDSSSAGGSSLRRVVSLVHLSDTHVCDAQSPARLAFTDYLGDPHYNGPDAVDGPLGNYRPNEMLTTQVMEATIRTVNKSIRSVVDGAKPDLVIITGDLVDNAQINELTWAKRLVEGGRLSPNSGHPDQYEGPGSVLLPDHFWNPQGLTKSSDELQALYGFPVVPDLLEASMDSFEAQGLHFETLVVHGNHDLMVQGTVPSSEEFKRLAVGENAPVSFRNGVDIGAFKEGLSPFGPTHNPALEDLDVVPVHADESRGLVEPNHWQELFERPAKYFAQHAGGALMVSLDTVNHHGGWDGSIDEVQFAWLENLLTENANVPVILLSHHSFFKFDNLYAPAGAIPRVGSEEFLAAVDNHSNVVMWLAGHDHRNRLHRIGSRNLVHVETASLIDWPQEGRLIELFEDGQDWVIISKIFSHESPTSWVNEGSIDRELDLGNLGHIAGLSREVAANHWQRRSGFYDSALNAGAEPDRDFVLRVPR
jgi:metallophosphoesterase (TIGR03767 family)